MILIGRSLHIFQRDPYEFKRDEFFFEFKSPCEFKKG